MGLTMNPLDNWRRLRASGLKKLGKMVSSRTGQHRILAGIGSRIALGIYKLHEGDEPLEIESAETPAGHVTAFPLTAP